MYVVILIYFIISEVFNKDVAALNSCRVEQGGQCPDVGYYLKNATELNEVDNGACYLCFCQDTGSALCWEREPWKCYYNYTLTKQRHRKPRSPAGLTDLFFRDGAKQFFNKQTKHECEPFEASYSDGCPPDDWCIGCTVCDCNANGHWDCHVLSFCADDKKRGKSTKRTIVELITPKPKRKNVYTRAKKGDNNKKNVTGSKKAKPQVKNNNKSHKHAKKVSKPAQEKDISKASYEKPIAKIGNKINALTRNKQKRSNPHPVKTKATILKNSTKLAPQKFLSKVAIKKQSKMKQDNNKIPYRKSMQANKNPVYGTNKSKVTMKTSQYSKSNHSAPKPTTTMKPILRKIVTNLNAIKGLVTVRPPLIQTRDVKIVSNKTTTIARMLIKKVYAQVQKQLKGKIESTYRRMNKEKNQQKRSAHRRNMINSNRRNKAKTTTKRTTRAHKKIRNKRELAIAAVKQRNATLSTEIDHLIMLQYNNDTNDEAKNKTNHDNRSKYNSTTESDLNYRNTEYYKYTIHTKDNNISSAIDNHQIILSDFTESNVESNTISCNNTSNTSVNTKLDNDIVTEINIKYLHNVTADKSLDVKLENKSNCSSQNETGDIIVLSNNLSNTPKEKSLNTEPPVITNPMMRDYLLNFMYGVNSTNEVFYKNKYKKVVLNDNIFEYINMFLADILKALQYGKSTLIQTNTERSYVRNSVNSSVREINKDAIKSLCDLFEPCRNGEISLIFLESKLNIIYNGVLDLMAVVKVIKGQLNMYSRNQSNGNNDDPQSYKIGKDRQTLLEIFEGKTHDKPLTANQYQQVKLIKYNTNVFLKLISKLAKEMSDVLHVLLTKINNGNIRNGTKRKFRYFIKKPIKPQDVNNEILNSKTNSLWELKHLLMKYKVLQNKFISKMYRVIENLNTNEKKIKVRRSELRGNHSRNVEYRIKHKMESNVFAKKILNNLKMLKSIAHKMGIRKNRKKRETIKDDSPMVYLLLLLEYMISQNAHLNDSDEDGIDMLIDAIKRGPSVKPLKKKVLQFTTPPYDEYVAPTIRHKMPEDIIKDSSSGTQKNIYRFEHEGDYEVEKQHHGRDTLSKTTDSKQRKLQIASKSIEDDSKIEKYIEINSNTKKDIVEKDLEKDISMLLFEKDNNVSEAETATGVIQLVGVSKNPPPEVNPKIVPSKMRYFSFELPFEEINNNATDERVKSTNNESVIETTTVAADMSSTGSSGGADISSLTKESAEDLLVGEDGDAKSKINSEELMNRKQINFLSSLDYIASENATDAEVENTDERFINYINTNVV